MVKNTLANKDANNKMVEFECNGETVKLSPAIVKNYLVNGNGNVTDQEVVMFLNLCRFQHLNPFLREAYLIKFGNTAATIVTGKEVFTKRAKRNKDYRGFEAGIIVLQEDGNTLERIGTFKLTEEQLVGGWAKVYINGFEKPVEITVSFCEYVGLKSDGEVNSQWKKKPATMIRKVALVQALREAFPEDFTGLYSPEEMDNVDILDTSPIEIESQEPKEPEIIQPEIVENDDFFNE